MTLLGLELVTDWIEIAGFAAAAIGLGISADQIRQAAQKATEERKAALLQAERDLEWRQTVEAQSAIRRFLDDRLAQDAMMMIDWDGRSFSIDGKNVVVSRKKTAAALSVGRSEFTNVEAFIRDRMDAFFNHFELMQQAIDSKIYPMEYIKFPIDYYVNRMKNEFGLDIFYSYLKNFGFQKAGALLKSISER